MITLRWVPLPNSDVVSYKVYRSIIGFSALLSTPAALAGQTLILAMNGTAAQTVLFAGTDDAPTQINAALVGGRAYPSVDFPTTFLLRSDIRSAPGSVRIIGGTALSNLGIAGPDFIQEKSEDILLATVAALVDPTVAVVYVDDDGATQDWYAISTVDHLAAESQKSNYQQPITTSATLCVLEGVVIDLQGRRISDVRVTATLIDFPSSPAQGSHVTLEPISTLTGPDGRYSLAALQGATIKIDIPCIGLSRSVVVPAAQFAFVSDLLTDDSATLPTDATLGCI